MIEAWRDIVGWEGLYEVSDVGRVRNARTGHVKKISPHKTLGYAFFTMKAAGRKQKTTTVHAEMARAFIGPRPDGCEVLHRDGDRMGNRLGNLRYGTRAENVKDTIRHGRVPHGERQHNAKLTEQDVIAIRKDWRGSRRLSRKYGVCRQTVDDVKAGKSWKHLLQTGSI